MANIPNTEYITVNANGIFVGEKPAETYRGEKIWNIDFVKRVFALMQEQNPKIEEFHIGAFATLGQFAQTGNPSGNHGRNAWCRVKFKNGNLGAWVFLYTRSSAANCAHYCAYDCADGVRNDASFRSAVFGAANEKQNSRQKQNALTNALKDTDLSQFVGKPVQLNGYKIIVEKIAETQQNKR